MNKMYKIFILLLILLGCQANETKIKTSFQATQIAPILEDILENQGYLIVDRNEKYVGTKWKTTLAPYYKYGKRDKVEVFIQPITKEQEITIVVSNEINYSTQDYLNENLALWVSNGRNRLEEKFLLSLIKQKTLLSK